MNKLFSVTISGVEGGGYVAHVMRFEDGGDLKEAEFAALGMTNRQISIGVRTAVERELDRIFPPPTRAPRKRKEK